MILTKKSSSFEPCPEFTGRAVCVDVTPLKKRETQFGVKDEFRIVFEVDLDKEEGGRWCVWSRGFSPSLNEKSNLYKFLRKWIGDIPDGFDTDSLIGKPAFVVVVHEHGKEEGQVYANIAAIAPNKAAEPLEPSGAYVRVQDRDEKGGTEYRGTSKPAAATTQSSTRMKEGATAANDDLLKIKVHVGRCKGLEFRELNATQIEALVANWLPTVQHAKVSADDKRLKQALAWWQAEREREDAAAVGPAEAREVECNF
jgi:hypothetical protein